MRRTLKVVRWLLAGSALLLVLPGAMAQAGWAEGRKAFKDNCAACHQVDGVHPTSGAQPLRNKAAATLQAFINAPPAGMTVFFSFQTTSPAINPKVSQMAVYLANANLGVGTLSPTSVPAFSELAAQRQVSGSVDVTLSAANDPSHGASLPNYGGLTISSIALSDATNYEITEHDCPATLAAGGSCTVKFRFKPQSPGMFEDGSLRFSHNGLDGGNVLSGILASAYDPLPAFAEGAGFAALATGFSADTGGSATLCPAVGNTGRYDDLSVSVQALVRGGSDHTGYYEIDSSPLACSSPPARCLPAGATSVTGSFTVAKYSQCTLAVKFNPGKYGFTGGTGTRPATLQLTHDGTASASPASYALGGVVTSGPTPRIGVTTTPSANALGQVLPAAFSSQVVGTASAAWKEFHVSNTGSADGLVIASVTQTNATEFTLTEDCVAAGALTRVTQGGKSCDIQMVFKPRAAPAGLGQRCTTVTVRASFAGIADESVQVCGTGVPVPVPAPSVDPPAIDFGRRSIGADYMPLPLVIANGAGATADLQISSVTIEGTGFAFVPDAAACAGQALARDTRCTLQLQFTPGTTPNTDYTADVVIASNDPAMPKRSVRLTATAVAAALPVLQWQSGLTALTFPGLVPAGQTSAQPQFARVVNAGPGAVDIATVRLVGPHASSFSATGCPALLYEGESCDIRVSFLPGSGGAKQAQLQVGTQRGVAPVRLPVSGQAVGGSSPYLLASMSSITFGDVRVGAQSEPVELRLSAGGDGVVTVTGMSVTGPFEVTPVSCPSAPFTLHLSSDCTVAVRYVPTDSAPATGTLKFGTEGPARTLEVALQGRAQPKADVSSGGCSMVDARHARSDPTLWLLMLAAAGVLWRRRGKAGTSEGDAP